MPRKQRGFFVKKLPLLLDTSEGRQKKKKKCMSDIKKLLQGKEWIHVISYRKINEGFGLAQEMKFSITDKKAHEGFL